jgi:hypothetical protein
MTSPDTYPLSFEDIELGAICMNIIELTPGILRV